MKDNERVKAYLKELAEVSKRHGLFISSCDCCYQITDEYGNKIESSLEFGINYDEETDSY